MSWDNLSIPASRVKQSKEHAKGETSVQKSQEHELLKLEAVHPRSYMQEN
jgi:hypothetical protein